MLSLLWAHILSKDQQVVEEDGLPYQVLLEDLIQHGQVTVRKSYPETIHNFCSDFLYNGGWGEIKLSNQCKIP